jgi:ParB-like chromosome segregation protein Spo0J
MKKEDMYDFEVQWLDIDSVIPYDKNPRKNDGAVETVMASLKRYGWKQAIAVRKENMTIAAGHTRWKAAKRLGMKKIPCAVSSMTDAEFLGYLVADNKSSEKSVWDDIQLKELILEVPKDQVTIEEMGFTQSEYKFVTGGFEFDLETKPKEDKEHVNLTTKLQLIVPSSIADGVKGEIEQLLKERGYAKDVAFK